MSIRKAKVKNYINVRLEKMFDVDVGFVLAERIDSHSAERQPRKEDEKLHSTWLELKLNDFIDERHHLHQWH